MGKPIKKVSIALATYNGEQFLEEQLNSIYSQTYDKFEVIACDDSSNDNTIKILKEFNRKKGLKYHINETRLGYLKNFEKAISLCTGDYIALSDQDDIWHPQKLELLIDRIGDHSLICSDLEMISDKGNRIYPSYIKYQKKKIPESDRTFERLVFDNYYPGCSMLFKKELKDSILPIPGEAINHDWWIAIMASLRGGIIYESTPLVKYRQHDSNTLGVKKISGIDYYIQKLNESIFNRAERKKKLSDRFFSNQKRIEYYIKHNVYKTPQDMELLNIAYRFYLSYSTGIAHFKTAYLGLKYSNYIYWEHSFLKRILYALMKYF